MQTSDTVTERTTPWCCVLTCDKDAEWSIDGDKLENSTRGCTEHVGELLNGGLNYVYPIPLGVTL